MDWLKNWLRTTFDYNPTFPLSALLLLGGLRVLSVDGSLDAASLQDTTLGVGILQAYELGLLAVALLVLWPRKIAYETTTILILVGIVRFASPFLAAGMAAEGLILEALAFGLVLAVLMTAKGEAVVRRIGLDLRVWERRYDYGLYLLAAVGFPWLGNRLAAWTGGAISHDQARLLHLSAWWGFAILLVPLCLGLRPLRRQPALQGRTPALVWRCLTPLGLTLLLVNALWVGGEHAPLLAYVPLVLVGVSLVVGIREALGAQAPSWACHAPAALAALVLLLPARSLLGHVPVLTRLTAFALVLPLAAGALALVARGPGRLVGLKSLAAITGVAPAVLASNGNHGKLYLACLGLALCAVGVARGRDRLVVHGALLATALGVNLCWAGRPVSPAVILCAGSALLAIAAASRELDGRLAIRVAGILYALPVLGGLWHAPDSAVQLTILATSGTLGLLAWRRAPALKWVAGGGVCSVLARQSAVPVDAGVLLVLLAFAAIPLGTTVALRRERRRTEEDVDLIPANELVSLEEDAPSETPAEVLA